VVEGLVVDELESSESESGDVVAVVDEDDDDGAAASVIWMRSCPSLESEFPSVATNVKLSTSTPDGAS
jgi:hypothetical protein